jgi:2-methylcitrate dehydratase PrpD
MDMPLKKIEDFVLKLSWENLPEKTRQITRFCVLDTIGCAVAGSRSEHLASHIATIRNQGQKGMSPVWGTDFSLNLSWSIFFNAHTAAYYDLDDGHRRAQGHPGATIIPVALATAHQLKLSGKAFLEAVVVGYEVAIRSALAIRSLGGPRKGSGGWATVGAAAATARLMGCSHAQVLHAIGLAEYYAPQAPQDRSVAFPSEMKEGIAWGAHSGFNSALLASGGFNGMRPHLADAAVIADLGEVYEIETSYFKKYASCRWAHPALDGLKLMLEEKQISPGSISEIRVFTFEKAVLMQRCAPTTVMEALYSIPYALGCFLINGNLGPQQLSSENIQNKKVLALAQRVKMIAEPELTARFPEHCLQRIEVDFNNGESYRGPLLSAKGDPDNPYQEGDLTDKFNGLTEGILGQQAERIPVLIKELERHSVAEFVTLLIPR